MGLLSSPLTRILVPAVLREALKFDNKPPGTEDESVDAFLRRRFGDDFAQIFGSALVHGIYAADSRRIGIRSAFPTMWGAAERGWGSIVRGSLLPSKKPERSDHDVGDVSEVMDQASVFSFRNGLQSLTDAMEQHLVQQNNVEILRGSNVSSVLSAGDRIEVSSCYASSCSKFSLFFSRLIWTTALQNPSPLSFLQCLLTSSTVSSLLPSALSNR